MEIKMKTLDFKEAILAMLDGKIVKDPEGDLWKFEEKNFKFQDDDVAWYRCEISDFGPYTIIKEPVKYSVELYLYNKPEPDTKANTLSNRIGLISMWSSTQTIACHTKYRITVEEIEEND